MRATNINSSTTNVEMTGTSSIISTPLRHTEPGKLPESASEISNAARGLLLRLLDRDPRVRMRNLRQLQQCAFYMGFNFEHIKAKKITPKSVLHKYFPDGAPTVFKKDSPIVSQAFATFDQSQSVA